MMKTLFRNRLLLLVILAFGLTFGLSRVLHKKEARENALQLLSINLADAANRLKRSDANVKTIAEMSASSALAKTRAFALLIKEDPSILQKKEVLKSIRKKLDVDELHVADETGKLIASLIEPTYPGGKDNHIGYNLNQAEQSRVFMQAISDPTFELAQEPQYSGAEQKLFQYTGVARLDAPGVVQIGYNPHRLQRAMQLADIKNIESKVRIGINGKLFIEENTKYPAEHKRVFSTREGLCKSVVFRKYLLTAFLPWNEVYPKNIPMLTVLFFGNLIVFALIFFMVNRLLHKIVIKEISAVTHTLEEFSLGNFDKMIAGGSSSEMHALIESINNVISSLKKSPAVDDEEETDVNAKLRKAMRPTEIPDNSHFKFSLEMPSVEESSSNLCDLIKIDKDRMILFFASSSEKGADAGFSMLKIKNKIRELLKKFPPEKVLRIVNREIYKSEKKMPLRLFLGIFNLRTGVLLAFNAGHADPVIKSSNGNVKFISGTPTPLLGSSSDAVFPPTPLQIYAGDKFYFYTNSILEIQNRNGEKYGSNRLLDAFVFSGNDAASAIKIIQQSITEFTGTETLQTDIAVAVLEYMP
jgi:hypothetical protein